MCIEIYTILVLIWKLKTSHSKSQRKAGTGPTPYKLLAFDKEHIDEKPALPCIPDSPAGAGTHLCRRSKTDTGLLPHYRCHGLSRPRPDHPLCFSRPHARQLPDRFREPSHADPG